MRRTLTGILLIAAVAVEAAADSIAFGPGLSRHGRLIEVPFDIQFDVNGEAFDVDIPNSRARLQATISDDDGLIDLRIDDRRAPRWLSNTIVDFQEIIDEADVGVRFFSIRRGLGATPRIFTLTEIEFNGDLSSETVLEHFSYNVPMTADMIIPLGPHQWEISGAFGPRHRFDTPLPLFSGVVEGRPFDVAIRELGFGEWEDVVVTNVPEPGTSAILTICAAIGGMWSIQRRKAASSARGL